MIAYKYILLDLLMSAIPHGLLLHGSHWDEITPLRHLSKGTLPRNDIPLAYSSAHVILASTTDEQRRAGMVNNRVFEALAV